MRSASTKLAQAQPSAGAWITPDALLLPLVAATALLLAYLRHRISRQAYSKVAGIEEHEVGPAAPDDEPAGQEPDDSDLARRARAFTVPLRF